MPRKVKNIVEPTRRSSRLRALGNNTIINLVGGEDEQSRNIRVPKPVVVRSRSRVRRRGIKRELEEDSCVSDDIDANNNEQTSFPVVECDDKDEESQEEIPELGLISGDRIQKNVSENAFSNTSIAEAQLTCNENANAEAEQTSASGTPLAERHSLARTIGNASIFYQDCFRNEPVERVGPVLLLRKSAVDSPQNNNQGVSLQPPTISEMLVPKYPFEQRQIDLMNNENKRHLRRSASRDWSQGSPDPDAHPKALSLERHNTPPKRARYEKFGHEIASPRDHNCDAHARIQPSCSYKVVSRNSNYHSETEDSNFEDYDLSSTNSDEKQSARSAKTCSTKLSIPISHTSRTVVCKSCGGAGHRNILDDHLKALLTKKLAKYGLTEQGRFSQ